MKQSTINILLHAVATAIQESLVCRRCGSHLPNVLGECRCSYSIDEFTSLDFKSFALELRKAASKL